MLAVGGLIWSRLPRTPSAVVYRHKSVRVLQDCGTYTREDQKDQKFG